MIVVNELKKQFGDETVLKKISFNVASGDRFGILGTSGAGKSTLLRCINGIETFQGGDLRTLNQRVQVLNKKELRMLKKQIGMVFQHDSLLERKNVLENVMLPLECNGMKKWDREKKAFQLLKMVGLQKKSSEKPKNLSGGQRQRAAIARALSLEPKILLCDEATSALDPKSTFEILDLLNQLNKEYKLTLVVVTHQIEVIKRLCNKVIILEQGEIKESGTVKNIFFRNPPALRKITGEAEIVAEKGKVLIKIVVDIKKIDLIGRLNRSSLPEWQLVYSTTEIFYDELLTLMIFSVGKEQGGVFTKLLDDWQIRYERM